MSGYKISSFWQSYKYRFVPWLAFNLKNRTVRRVDGRGEDKVVTDEEVLKQLGAVTSALVARLSTSIAEQADGRQRKPHNFSDDNRRSDGRTSCVRPDGLNNSEHILKECNDDEHVMIRSNKLMHDRNNNYAGNVNVKVIVNNGSDNLPNDNYSNIQQECTINSAQTETNNNCKKLNEDNLHSYELKSNSGVGLGAEDNSKGSADTGVERGGGYTSCRLPPHPSPQAHREAIAVMAEVLKYHVEKCSSAVGGTGVRVICRPPSSRLSRGRVVCLYPGTLYLPQQQPVLLQSFANKFLFRCIDGLLLDGNDRQLSGMLFRSCVGRDRIGPFPVADQSWMSKYPLNPLNIGQYVNNQSKAHPSNVAYQEVTLWPGEVPLEERCYLPNLWYKPPPYTPVSDVPLRLVALVTTREVKSGEELFSDYFTVVS